MGKSQNKRSSSNANSLAFSVLEKRAMLAAIIDFDPTTGIVSVEGTKGHDQVIVNYVDGRQSIRIAASDVDSVNRLQLNASEITSIQFNGNDGDDLFRNNTHRQSVAHGGNGNDVLVGGWRDDFLSGDSGNDVINGRHGADDLHGNSGRDILRGGPGDDQIFGGAGGDTISGGAGLNTIDAGLGDDIVFGGQQIDIIDGSDGNDFIHARGGDDIVSGGNGIDVIRGGAGQDELDGGLGNDRVSGEAGDDILYGSEGVDRLFGGSDNDEIYGGEDDDFLFGGNGDDTLVGDTGDDLIYGEAGRDTLKGSDGNDGLYGGLGGLDRLEGGRGADRLLSLVDSNNRLEELVLGFSTEDAIIRFEGTSFQTVDINGIGNVTFTSKAWTDAEIRIVDQALSVLHSQVDSTALLKTHSGVALRFQRTGDLIGQSFEIGGFNQSGTIGLSNSAFRSELRALAVTYHEVGHNFDQAHENSLIPQFEAISGWQNRSGSGLRLSTGGGAWHYDDSASEFARDYGRFHPQEDYATTWETYFTVNHHNANGWRGTDIVVPEKFANLDAFFETFV